MKYTLPILRSFAVALLLGVAAFGNVAQAAGGTKNGVVLQVSDNDPAKWNLTLNNAKNLQGMLGKNNVKIEIVAYGPGLNMLKADSEVAGRLADAKKNGVELAACGNTMKAMHLTKMDLDPNATVVPAGIVEIMHKEQQGWTYVRP